jgi:hypothetical protein
MNQEGQSERWPANRLYPFGIAYSAKELRLSNWLLSESDNKDRSGDVF